MHITCAGRTDVGIIRSGNEDNFLMVPDRGIFVVADGMGGHAAGEVASEMAVRFVARELGSLKSLSDDQVADRMRTAIRAANGAIFQRTLTEHDKRGMGTTVTAVVLYFWRELLQVVAAWAVGVASWGFRSLDQSVRDTLEYRMGWYLILATIPVSVAITMSVRIGVEPQVRVGRCGITGLDPPDRQMVPVLQQL